MIDGNARDFLNKLYYEDHYVIFNGEKYFLNGCQTKKLDNGTESVRLEVYNLTRDTTVFSVTKTSAADCIDAFEEAVIWNGRTFWEIESEIMWVDE